MGHFQSGLSALVRAVSDASSQGSEATASGKEVGSDVPGAATAAASPSRSTFNWERSDWGLEKDFGITLRSSLGSGMRLGVCADMLRNLRPGARE